jgi:hypothetical protein
MTVRLDPENNETRMAAETAVSHGYMQTGPRMSPP